MKEEIKETRLDNGLVVLSDRMPDVRSATLGFFYRVGSRNEPDELNGITHFIEHCVFKGSAKRSALDIAIEQDRLGGGLDAFTTHEETGFVIKVVDDQFERAFNLMADMLTAPRFDESDLINERRVIIEEIKMNEDSPDEVLSDIFHREFFRGHQLGMSIAGTPDTVSTFSAERTADYHRHTFNPSNLIVAAAGNIEHDRLMALLDVIVKDSRSHPDVPRLELSVPVPEAPIVIERRSDLEQAHVLIATPIVAAPDPRRYAADLLANALGGGTSSRLWQKIREERGLAYSVGASTGMFNDCGFLAVSAATSPDQVAEVTDIVIEEMRAVVKEGVSQDELDLMKDQARASILLGLEDSAARAATLAQCEMVHGRQISVEETLINLEAVTTDDLHDVAREFFQTERVAYVALGNLKKLDVPRERLRLD